MQESSETSDVRGFDSYQVKLGDLMRGERATLGKSLLDVQRDLRIKATFIAAIENSDPSVFQTPGFIAGYVRSYARYLGMDPDDVFAMFCAESEFSMGVDQARPKVKSLANSKAKSKISDMPDVKASSGQTLSFARPVQKGGISNARAAFSVDSSGILGDISLSAVASVVVLLVLIFGIGYGGWSVLQDVQRVEFAPVEQTPGAFADSDLLTGGNPGQIGPASSAGDAAARLYRPQELDLPVLVARDGPILTIDPNTTGALVSVGIDAEIIKEAAPETALPQVTEVQAPPLRIVAARAAWVRLSEADGSIIFEKILDGGESIEIPAGISPILRAGNAGSVFVSVGDKTYGPVGDGTAVVKNVVVGADQITQEFALVSDDKILPELENPSVITLNLTEE